ncbi:MAG: AmmeMemoRadiSam system protein B [Victivallales bacterium]|nr:AmmeMemoRadiSam system protein B [Victivallales bacterium]
MKKTLLVIVALLAFATAGYGAENILVSHLKGLWYPSTEKALNKAVSEYLNKVKEKKMDNTIALILPHAGYKYSGQTAAYGIKEIVGKKYSRVIILGPSHSHRLGNKLSMPSYKSYRTPLGDIELDRKFIDKLNRKMPYATMRDVIHMKEHSIQIQLPLLQKALGEFRLVPIVVGQLNSSTVKNIAEVLKNCIDDKTLVIASSDFTHYGRRFGYLPFTNDFQTEDKLKKLDMGAVQCIENKNPEAFRNYIRKTGATICGENPISILLYMLPNDSSVTLLHYETSGEQSGDFSNSVSYAAIAAGGSWDTGSKVQVKKEVLTQKDKEKLLKLAEKSIEYYLKNKSIPDSSDLDIRISENMKKVMGCFVSLYENGKLRGCIGEIMPKRPLYKAVISQAVNAAVRDYRFPPVKASEINNLKIEISALTPPEKVHSYKDIVIGRDGMTLNKNGHFAVFLPQVAPDQGWNLEQTLSYLSMKAGLSRNAWKNGAEFSVFQAIVFNNK